MKSLFELYTSVWDCYDYTNDTDNNNSVSERMERGKQAADGFAINLIALGERWVSALENNIEELAATTPPPNITNRKAFYNGKRLFLNDVCNALNIHGFSYREIRKQLTPFACYFLGLESSKMVIKNGLQKDEALGIYEEMKGHGFSYVRIFKEDILPDVFSVLGYKQPKSDPKREESEDERKFIQPYIDEAITYQYIKRNGDAYKWVFGGRRGLVRLGYFVSQIYRSKYYSPIPFRFLNKLFGVSRLDSAIDRCLGTKNPQKWRGEIDTLINKVYKEQNELKKKYYGK